MSSIEKNKNLSANKEKKKRKNKINKTFKGMACLVVIMVAVWALVVVAAIKSDIIDLGHTGTFGDSFGIITSLFTGLAFAGLIYTILLQESELKKQKKELRLTKEVFVRQNFENAFFNMIMIYNEIIKSIDIKINNELFKTLNQYDYLNINLNFNRGDLLHGRDCFKIFFCLFMNEYELKLTENDLGEENDETRLKCAWEEFFKKHQCDIGHYFRHLYNMIKFIDETKIESDDFDKKFYTKIIHSQLSSYELVFIFYSYFGDFGSEKFKSLVKKYSMLDGMNIDLIPKDYENHISVFKKLCRESGLEEPNS